MHVGGFKRVQPAEALFSGGTTGAHLEDKSVASRAEDGTIILGTCSADSKAEGCGCMSQVILIGLMFLLCRMPASCMPETEQSAESAAAANKHCVSTFSQCRVGCTFEIWIRLSNVQ